MDFWNRLKDEENLNRLYLFLWTDEQQEFLERAKLLIQAKEKFFKESVLVSLSQEEYDNENRYNFLLDKAIVLSRMSKEDRLWFLFLMKSDQEHYVQFYLKMRKILDWDEIDNSWNSEDNLKEYDLLLEKIKSRYNHRSLL